MKSLYAFYLGGRAEGCNVELHDVVFTAAVSYEDNYPLLVKKWFGQKKRLHIDAWMRLDSLEGFDIKLAAKGETAKSSLSLFFVNLGAYVKEGFSEIHECGFFVGENPMDAKRQAKKKIEDKGFHFIHTDDLYDIDDVIELAEVDGFSVIIERNPQARTPLVTNGYIKIPSEFLG